MVRPSDTADIITLENFAARMPRWDPDGENQLYAVVDMGSNGIRFSVTTLKPPHSRLLRCLFRERAGISLFDALSSSPDFTFPRETIEDVVKALTRFKHIAKAHNVPFEHIAVFATEAMRRANNADAMLEAIHDGTGMKVHILAGEVETLFGSAGARSAFSSIKGLVLDLGGGSVQMTWLDTSAGNSALGEGNGVVTPDDEKRVEQAGDHSIEPEGYEVAAARAGRSMPFGAARMTGVLEGSGDSVVKTTKEDLHSQMRESFRVLTSEFPALAQIVEKSSASNDEKDGIDIYLCGGGFRGYGSMLMYAASEDPGRDVPYPIMSVASYKVTGSEFCKTKRMMDIQAEAVKEGRKIFGLSKRRLRQFPAIVAVVDALVGAVAPAKIRSATFCAGSNREGALFMMLPREVRESHPLPLLAVPAATGQPNRHHGKMIESVVEVIRAALPGRALLQDTPTVFSLGLAHVFVSRLWARPGGDPELNASAALHECLACEHSTAPGMTHTARTVLALSNAARWGVVRSKGVAPAERPLFKGLQGILGADASFWAAFIGTVAWVLTQVVVAMPSEDLKRSGISFKATAEQVKKKTKINLHMQIPSERLVGISPRDLAAAFADVKQNEGNEKKVVFEIAELP